MGGNTEGGSAARFFLDPFGCAKNQVDAEIIIANLERAGFGRTLDPEEADVIIVNSCGFVETAKKEAINAVIDHKARWPGKKVILAGCLAERYNEELRDTLTEADGFFGNSDLSRAPEAVKDALSGSRPFLIPSRGELESGTGRTQFLSYPGTAYVKISEGCSNNCSYCAIPIIRGSLSSREIPSIVDEIGELVARGMKEINLVGQDSGSFGVDTTGKRQILALLEAILAIPGDFRVRALYIHPDHFPEEILPLFKKDKRLVPYFDIPFQHASKRILAAMNRSGDSATYLALLERIRREVPEAVTRSTFLLGFPGETEEDVRELLDFVATAKLDWAGAFAYSREDGTKAYDMKGRVPKKTAEERKKRVEELQAGITATNLERHVGKRYRALVEEKIEGEELWIGRIEGQAPDVDGLTVIAAETLSVGAFVDVKIIKANPPDLEAVPT